MSSIQVLLSNMAVCVQIRAYKMHNLRMRKLLGLIEKHLEKQWDLAFPGGIQIVGIK